MRNSGNYEAVVADGHVFAQTGLIPYPKLAAGSMLGCSERLIAPS